jgi:hypothetical protein
MASVHTDTPRSRGDEDAPHLSPVTPGEDVRTILINRVSWGAVIAGVVIALVVQLIGDMVGGIRNSGGACGWICCRPARGPA